MSESAGGSVVGVVGQALDTVAGAVSDAGGRTVTGDVATVLGADPDRLVAVGNDALCTLVADTVPDAPVLPVDAGEGVRSVPLADARAGVDAFLADDWNALSYPVVGVTVDGTLHARALEDVMLVTAEPARISEYSVTDCGTHVATFRADGVVVATPAGSHGYARRVDAPVVAHGTGVAAVEPIAPFATDADHWVLPVEGIGLTVDRDEATVELHADDRRVGPVDADEVATLSVVDRLEVASVPASGPPFADGTPD